MTEPITETWPDLPPITDERAYQACLGYAKMLEDRGITGDARTEHGALLLKLRRAAELWEKTAPEFARQDASDGAMVLQLQLTDARKRIEELELRERDWHKLADERSAELIKTQAELERRTEWSNTELAFRKSQAEDNENAWQCEKQKRVAAELTNALLLRRLRHRNETIAFLTKSKLSFDDNDNPNQAVDHIFYNWWHHMRARAEELAEQYRREVKKVQGLKKYIGRLTAANLVLAVRLHVKRIEARHWTALYADLAVWSEEYQKQILRDGREIIGLELRLDLLNQWMADHAGDLAPEHEHAILEIVNGS